ncbi:hypothetical protein BpHYR1_006011, partial [Brachionus plicatilis]
MVSEEIRLDNDDTLDDTSDQDDFQEPVTIKSRGTGKIYLHHKNYEKQLEQNSISSTNWNSNGSKILKNDRKLEYFCRYKKNGCKVAMYALTADENLFRVFISDNEHTCHQDNEETKIPEETQKHIKQLDSLGTKPEAILHQLTVLGIPPVKKSDLTNFLQKIRTEKKEVAMPTLQDLKNWCDNRLELPESEDQVFVGKYEIQALPVQTFKIFLTTKRLLSFACINSHILSDATYKLLYGGFPVLTGGTTDKSRKLHPFGLALCKTEQEDDFAFYFKALKENCKKHLDFTINQNILVADNADNQFSIENGFRQIFNLEKRVNYWAH